jgi:hypothetical protein
MFSACPADLVREANRERRESTNPGVIVRLTHRHARRFDYSIGCGHPMHTVLFGMPGGAARSGSTEAILDVPPAIGREAPVGLRSPRVLGTIRRLGMKAWLSS